MWRLLTSILSSPRGQAPSIQVLDQGSTHPPIVSFSNSTQGHTLYKRYNLWQFLFNILKPFFFSPRSPQVPSTRVTFCPRARTHSRPPLLLNADRVFGLAAHHSAYTTATSTSQAREENSEYLSSSFSSVSPLKFKYSGSSLHDNPGMWGFKAIKVILQGSSMWCQWAPGSPQGVHEYPQACYKNNSPDECHCALQMCAKRTSQQLLLDMCALVRCVVFVPLFSQIRICDPNQGGRDITEEIMAGGSGSRNSTPPVGPASTTSTPPQVGLHRLRVVSL